jgi:hypothetical protein
MGTGAASVAANQRNILRVHVPILLWGRKTKVTKAISDRRGRVVLYPKCREWYEGKQTNKQTNKQTSKTFRVSNMRVYHSWDHGVHPFTTTVVWRSSFCQLK